jgi:hypothetical protein
MGRGSRHSKNAGVMGAEALTYHERKALGYGSLKERLGKDAQGNYYDCCLTLQPAVVRALCLQLMCTRPLRQRSKHLPAT